MAKSRDTRKEKKKAKSTAPKESRSKKQYYSLKLGFFFNQIRYR